MCDVTSLRCTICGQLIKVGESIRIYHSQEEGTIIHHLAHKV